MQEDHIERRIQSLEQADKELSESIQRLALQTERIAIATETLQRAIDQQAETNKKFQHIEIAVMENYSNLDKRIQTNENTMKVFKYIGYAILGTGVAMVMTFLFGNGITPSDAVNVSSILSSELWRG